MTPLLYWHLDAACQETVPEKAFDHLRDHFRANSLHNLSLTRELLRILNAFEAHGIPVVPYKGPSLAVSVYGNLALRQFIDLDIMVHRHDVPKTKELLASLNYRPQYRLTRAQEAALLGSRCTYVFTREDGKSTVEVHWGIVEHFSFPLDLERLWGRLEQIKLGGEVVLTLSPEDTLLVLCVHGFKHLWERLGWICDVAELIRVCQDTMKWEQLMVEAEALGCERMVLLGLVLANNLLGADVPDEVFRRVNADPTVKALAKQICEQLFRDANSLEGLFEGAYFRPLHLKMRERLPEKIRYFVRAVAIPTEEDWKLLPLPGFLFPLYHVLRPIRLAGKYGPRMLRRLL
jgi:Uncharacterised nucleotidyltransferase